LPTCPWLPSPTGSRCHPANALTAWRVGSDCTTLRTVDARAWAVVTPQTADSPNGFAAIDADTAILMDHKNVYSTTDGGRTWAANPLPPQS
jgi:photosystem II stability/assembly factor-like uncharacterized protein